MSNTEPLIAEMPGRDEELARADWYGTLACLFYAPPSQELLDRIAAAELGRWRPSRGGLARVGCRRQKDGCRGGTG